jgi:hypothetical protein
MRYLDNQKAVEMGPIDNARNLVGKMVFGMPRSQIYMKDRAINRLVVARNILDTGK